jgi:hypothetical protein
MHSVEEATNQIRVELGNGILRFDQLLIGEGEDSELRSIEHAMRSILNNRRMLH